MYIASKAHNKIWICPPRNRVVKYTTCTWGVSFILEITVSFPSTSGSKKLIWAAFKHQDSAFIWLVGTEPGDIKGETLDNENGVRTILKSSSSNSLFLGCHGENWHWNPSAQHCEARHPMHSVAVRTNTYRLISNYKKNFKFLASNMTDKKDSQYPEWQIGPSYQFSLTWTTLGWSSHLQKLQVSSSVLSISILQYCKY